jgi:Domain of unknown function (DUF4412)
MRFPSALVLAGTVVFSVLAPFGGFGLVGCKKLASSVGIGGGTESEAPNVLSGFEGELGARFVDAKGKTVDVVAELKGDRVRIAIPAALSEMGKAVDMADGYVLLQSKDKRAYLVSDLKKKAIVVDIDKAAAQAKQFGGGAGRTPSPTAVPSAVPETVSRTKIVRTGKKDKVAGFECEEWEVTDESKPQFKANACIANQAASWLVLPTKALPDRVAFAAELLDGKHFPLRAIVTEGGAQSMRVEVTKIEKKSLSDARFEVPADYQIVDVMSAMMGMMGGAQGFGGPSPEGQAPGLKLPPNLKLPPGIKLR